MLLPIKQFRRFFMPWIYFKSALYVYWQYRNTRILAILITPFFNGSRPPSRERAPSGNIIAFDPFNKCSFTQSISGCVPRSLSTGMHRNNRKKRLESNLRSAAANVTNSFFLMSFQEQTKSIPDPNNSYDSSK